VEVWVFVVFGVVLDVVAATNGFVVVAGLTTPVCETPFSTKLLKNVWG